ncbi:MAG: hypothetical protein HOP30_14285 [Cyclobacteriaceae bacterium]|nr:hypothetical protein [Cyclobacteriaceae bacterium]
MKKWNQLAVVIISVVGSALFQQCTTDNPAPVAVADVYVAGTTDAGEPAFAKNGVITKVGDASVNTSVYSITVSGNDVYIAGARGENAVYWKNNTMTTIPNDANTSWTTAYEVEVKNYDVYVLLYGLGGPSNFVKYLKNGVATECSNGQPTDMAIAETNDVYISGNTNDRAGFWKNGVWSYLTELNSRATAVKVVGTDIYFSGFYYDNLKGWMPVYWKNGTMVAVDTVSGMVEDMEVVNGDVYMTGYSNQNGGGAAYWKNTTLVSLDLAGFTATDSYGIAVRNGDVYVTGRDYTANKTLLWKNGKLVKPFDGTSSDSFSALFVK